MSEVLLWLDEPLDKMSREELIEVIHEMSKILDEQRNAHRRDMDFLYGDLLTARPIKKTR